MWVIAGQSPRVAWAYRQPPEELLHMPQYVCWALSMAEQTKPSAADSGDPSLLAVLGASRKQPKAAVDPGIGAIDLAT